MRRLLFVLISMVGACFTWGAPVQNVIWVIGDGMGPEILGFWMQGARYAHLNGVPSLSHTENIFNKAVWGFFFNNTYDTVVTDSAAAATQMATGQLSRPLLIGMDAQYNPVPNFMELARQHGKAVGIISDAYVTDATPAAFTAHVKNRRQRDEIARQQIAFGPEVLLGGGLQYFTRGENKDLLRTAQAQGYRVVQNKKQLAKVKRGKVLGLFADQAMPMAVEMYRHPKVPTLTDMTRQAVQLLQQHDGGFVLMVEAGKIDWAAHANDPGAVLAEMKELDRLLGFLQEYADQHPHTLIYVNADHDTGLGGFVYRHVDAAQTARHDAQGEVLYDGNTDYASFHTYNLFEKQKRSLYDVYKTLKALPAEQRTRQEIQKQLSDALGYPVDMDSFDDLTDLEGIFKQLNTHRGLAYATLYHSAAPLLSVAYGAGAGVFGGVYHNTDILPRLREVLGW